MQNLKPQLHRVWRGGRCVRTFGRRLRFGPLKTALGDSGGGSGAGRLCEEPLPAAPPLEDEEAVEVRGSGGGERVVGRAGTSMGVGRGGSAGGLRRGREEHGGGGREECGRDGLGLGLADPAPVHFFFLSLSFRINSEFLRFCGLGIPAATPSAARRSPDPPADVQLT